MMSIPARPAENPWVLIRPGKPVVRFPALAGAQQFFDQLRRNVRQPEAHIRGPNGEGWYCAGERSSLWVRDDSRRKREAPAENAEGGEAAA